MLKKIYKIMLITVLCTFFCASAAAQDASLPYPTESGAEFSAEIPVDDLLVGDLVYINFNIKNSENIFAFEAEIEYDTEYFAFSEISSDVMDVSVTDEGDGTIGFAASMLGEGKAGKESLPIKLVLKSRKSGSGKVMLKNAILVYDDLSYTKFDDINESVNVKVKRASSTSPSGSGGGGGGGGSAGGYYPSGNIAVQSTSTPAPTDIAPVEEENDYINENKIEFTDLGSVEWAREAIESLSEKGVINGIGDGLFNPSGKITRAEFAKIIVLASGISIDGAECDYSDVPKDEWYYPYIAAATQNSLLKGYVSGEFRPTGYITREETAVVCARTIPQPEATEEDGKTEVLSAEFNDKSEISDFAYDSVCLLYSMGIVSGDNEGNFNPRGNLIRAEAAKIIYTLTGGAEK